MSLWKGILPPNNNLLPTHFSIFQSKGHLKQDWGENSIGFSVENSVEKRTQLFVLCFIFLWLKKLIVQNVLILLTLNLMEKLDFSS